MSNKFCFCKEYIAHLRIFMFCFFTMIKIKNLQMLADSKMRNNIFKDLYN